MTYSIEELRELLEQCERLPYGPGQIAQVEEVIRHADAHGDRRLMFDARMVGSDAYTFGGEPAKAFVTFSWCLAEFDRSSSLFTPWDDEQLRWHYKWIVSSLRDFPEIQLDQTFALLDDMERRYRLGGHSLHAVYSSRWCIAAHIGDTDAADRWFDLWCESPRDENSDCEGCDPTSKVSHLVARGRDEEAIVLAEPVLAGRLTCHQQPHSMLTELMVPYVRMGQYEKAREAHLRGYRGFRDRLADLYEIGQHIDFCGLTGNEARGLELIERHLDWLERSPSPRSTMEFATASAVVLRELVNAGQSHLTVYRRASANNLAGDVSVGDLFEEMTALARSQAARFDARNQTDHCGHEVERRLKAQPLMDYLPLSAVERASAQRLSGRPRTASRIAVSPVKHHHADNQTTRLPLAEISTPDEFLDQMDQVWSVFDVEAYYTLWDLLASTTAHAELTDRQQARMFTARARVLINRDHDIDGAIQSFEEAIKLYNSCHDEVSVRVAETGLGRILVDQGDVDRGLALITTAIDWLSEQGHSTDAVGCELTLIATLMSLGRFYEASELARSTRERAAVLERTEETRIATIFLGFALEEMEEYLAAVEAFEEVLKAGRCDPLHERARARRAHILVNTSRAVEVVDDLVETVAMLVSYGETHAAARARFDLTIAYHMAGELLDAAETAETAIRALGDTDQPTLADRCRYRLSKIYVDLGENSQALSILDELVSRLDGFDNLSARGQVHEDAGRILFQVDKDTAAATRFAAAEECYRSAGLLHDAARALRARAVALSWTDETDGCLAILAKADQFMAQLPHGDPMTEYERIMLEVDAARVLANVDRPEQAIERLTGVPRRLREIDSYSEALDAEFLHARLLLWLGRVSEGETFLRSVIASSPEDSDVHRSSVLTLINALEELGRHDEANTLRAAYGLGDGENSDISPEG